MKKQTLNLFEEINQFEIIRALSNVSVDENVYYFTKTLLNVIHRFIAPERFVCSGTDPTWINNKFKKLINQKNFAYKSY